MQHVEVSKIIDAPIQQVWDRYTDHVSWTRWAGLGKVRLAKEGVPPPNGVGCVRAFTNAGFELHEEVLTFEVPRRMTYKVVKGSVPMKDHLGEVTFEPQGDSTRIVWRCQFNSTIPGLGGVFRWFVTHVFRRALDGLARTFRA
jgi:uncharacterized protein YndB with AHSA1/START domain